jgi:hypothetical protein
MLQFTPLTKRQKLGMTLWRFSQKHPRYKKIVCVIRKIFNL